VSDPIIPDDLAGRGRAVGVSALAPGVVLVALEQLAAGVGHGYGAAQVVLVGVAPVGGAVAPVDDHGHGSATGADVILVFGNAGGGVDLFLKRADVVGGEGAAGVEGAAVVGLNCDLRRSLENSQAKYGCAIPIRFFRQKWLERRMNIA
jgi:hypothetical protein